MHAKSPYRPQSEPARERRPDSRTQGREVQARQEDEGRCSWRGSAASGACAADAPDVIHCPRPDGRYVSTRSILAMQDPSDSSQPLSPPRGMRDFYPEEMALRTFIFDAWRNATRAHGFAMYDSCVVESLDLLKRKSGEEIVNQIYAFADKSGRELALRPEMTPTLARMVAARQGSLPFPLKWAAIGQC
ncbi:MAG: hypothetical protein FJ224_13060, partial [Lentisphaerae bacterium]|nr:hypothetical protein [Lentisphaerota bacterium]